jgi:hypothetical protein
MGQPLVSGEPQEEPDMARLGRTRRLWFSLPLALLLVTLGPGAASAVTLHVASNGEDSDGCGAEGSPCRSINRAIANADRGDTIIVGPGRYGDLDGDGAFDGAGEETAPAECGCMINVNKQVTLQSRDGAGVTVLDAGHADVNVLQVSIGASDAVVGGREKGFTLTRGQVGLIFPFHPVDATVQGNLAVRNARDGFVVFGTGARLTSNLAIANGENGFFVSAALFELTGNLAVANGVDGFAVANRGLVGSDLRGNRAVANRSHGFAIGGGAGGDVTVSNNAALGNHRFGIALFTDKVTITKNNIYGNNAEAFNGLTNCGLHMAVDGSLDVTNNFWGSADGPGLDPADAICNPGEAGIDSEPFATREFRISAPLPRPRPPLPPPVDLLPHD